jgi:hypothetical protein
MSDLDVLDEIAEQTAFGNGDLNDAGRRFHRPAESEATNKDRAKAKKKRRVKYSAREYPL